MKVGGMRAVQAVKSAMAAAGLDRISRMNGAEIAGWIESNRFGSTGFSIAVKDDGTLRWHVVLSGKPHMQYRSFKELQGDEVMSMSAPVNPDVVHGRLRAVFERLGMVVKGVKTTGWQNHWDDDVDFEIVTDHPEWLAYDPTNASLLSDCGVTLRSAQVVPRRSDLDPPPLRTSIPVYVHGGVNWLTREGVEAMAKAASEHNREVEARRAGGRSWRSDTTCSTAEITSDGVFRYARYGRVETEELPTTIQNFWGDDVQVWRAPSGMLREDPVYSAAVPALVAGEMREKVPFELYDAQFGPSPWNEPAPEPYSGPRP